MGEKGADDAAVADHEHIVAIRVPRGDCLDGAHDASLHGMQRLAARRQPDHGVPHPPGIGIARQRPDLLHGAALPLPERQLAQILHGHHGHGEPGGDDLRRAPGAREGARVDGRQPAPAQRLAQGLGLTQPERRQRHILHPLEAAHRIGDRLAVAGQQQAHLLSRLNVDDIASRLGLFAPPGV